MRDFSVRRLDVAECAESALGYGVGERQDARDSHHLEDLVIGGVADVLRLDVQHLKTA